MGCGQGKVRSPQHRVRFAVAVTALAGSVDFSPPGNSQGRRRNMKKEYDFSKGKRGRVLRVPPGKTRVTIRIDDDILNFRRVIRDEIRRAG